MQALLPFQANCAFGLESVVKQELLRLGFEARGGTAGRVLFSAPLEAIPRINLWLRTADRLRIIVGQFLASDFDALFEQTLALPWEEWIPLSGAFPVTGRSHGSQLTSVPAVQRSVKKAVALRLQKGHQALELLESGGQFAVDIELKDNVATLTLDTTGPSLHKRGYRQIAGLAPLKETLAAALVMLSGWRPERPFLDPFCGSGTLCLEAAMIGRNLAPGSWRDFTSESWPHLPAELWKQAREEAADLAKRNRPLEIVGSDHDPSAVKLSGYHRSQLGINKGVRFIELPFDQIEPTGEYGCLVTNPPYGERLGERAEVEALYQAFPRVLRKFKTWSHHILAPTQGFEASLGQAATRRRKLYNGRLECTFFQFLGPKPPRPPRDDKGKRLAEASTPADPMEETASSQDAPPIATSDEWIHSATHHSDVIVPVPLPEATVELPQKPVSTPTVVEVRPAFGGLTPKAGSQAELFAARLRKTARHLRRWPERQDIHCFRLYDKDIPEIPLCVDRYEQFLHIAEYARPHERTPAEHADWLDLMCQTAAEVLEIPAANVFLKRRERQRGTAQYSRVDDRQATHVVQEGGLKFEVNLSDYLDTGLFLDHRQTREMVRQAARGTRMLNLFCYTGSFTVYAVDGHAQETVSVDSSAVYLAWAQRNLKLNGLQKAQHQYVRADVKTYLRELPANARFDLIVCDPPTFSNSKRTEDDFDVQAEHAPLLTRLVELLTPGGILFFSTNFRQFKFQAELPGVQVREISRQTVPPDFRNQRIHRCWRITKPKPGTPTCVDYPPDNSICQ